MTCREPRMVVVLSKVLVGLFFQAAILFLGAGSIAWREAWIYLGASATASLTIALLLKQHNPDLLERRLTLRTGGTDPRDETIFLAGIPFYVAFLLVPGLDAVRWNYSEIPDPVKALAFGLLVVSFVLVWRVMRENAFLTRTIEIQTERGHHVITTGPYRVIRHPFYAAVILSFFAIPVALGSWLGLLPATGLGVIIVVRTRIEESVLLNGLEGYQEYMQTVRYRLLPGIW